MSLLFENSKLESVSVKFSFIAMLFIFVFAYLAKDQLVHKCVNLIAFFHFTHNKTT